MGKQNRTDKILIALALLILLAAGGAFYFDNWMWGARGNRGAKIGAISLRNGDVRVKFEGDLKWGKASRGQELIYNDAIYAGQDSKADIALGNSNMTVQQNTLIVLRREKNVNFLNLNYGTLFGKVAKDEKIMIDTGVGKPIEFTPTSRAQIVLSKNNGKTELKVISGEANITIDGKKRKVDSTSKVVLDEKAPVPEPVIEKIHLIATRPLKEQIIYSDKPMQVPFAWDVNGVREGQSYSLEFATEPSFQKIYTTKNAGERLQTTMSVSKSLSLFYRVRGPHGATSQTEKINFVRMNPPLIAKPAVDQIFVTPAAQNAQIQFEFNREANAGVWYQVATDPDFNQIVANRSIASDQRVEDMAAGSYFVRARAVYPENHVSSWTSPQAFRIDPKLEPLRLSDVPATNRVLIPNESYPQRLYMSSNKNVQAFLAQKGFLKNYFPFAQGSFDKVQLSFDGEGTPQTRVDANWPTDHIKPGAYTYKYQVSKAGFEDTAVSNPKRLEIAMEPPRALGTKFTDPLEDGSREARMAFTPILFARSYDVEIAPDQSFENTIPMKTESAVARRTLPPGNYFWRARARDGGGRVISDYSEPAQFHINEIKAAPVLAKVEEPPPERAPAATNTSALKLNETTPSDYQKNGWWAWLGTGMNYVDYKQSVQGRGTITSHSPKGPSQYVEAGYNSSAGFGGVFSYKSTPGEIAVSNASVDSGSFNWTTMSLEAVMRKLAEIPFTDKLFTYGLRVGVQEHKTPFVFLDSDANLQLKQNTMQTASFGLLGELNNKRWTHYGQVRYQYPFSSKASGSDQFEIKPTFAFDGLVGSSYNITKQFKVGLFWYGQWHQYNFVYGDSQVTNTGFQSLFYSNIDLRLGFDF